VWSEAYVWGVFESIYPKRQTVSGCCDSKDDPTRTDAFDRPTIYTLGTSTRGIEEFVRVMDAYGVVCVVDVRRFPTSRLDHFKGENLRVALEARGFEYVYMGDDLGGYRKGGYGSHMVSEAFKRGVKTLVSLASRVPTVVVCAERLPWRCHRRFIGQVLQSRGWHVVHLIERGRIWTGQGRTEGGA
jgi:uncharacterized protein (DUF488 family)